MIYDDGWKCQLHETFGYLVIEYLFLLDSFGELNLWLESTSTGLSEMAQTEMVRGSQAQWPGHHPQDTHNRREVLTLASCLLTFSHLP